MFIKENTNIILFAPDVGMIACSSCAITVLRIAAEDQIMKLLQPSQTPSIIRSARPAIKHCVSQSGAILMAFLLMLGAGNVLAQQAPPELGQETKGTPAVDETASEVTSPAASSDKAVDGEKKKNQKGAAIDNLLGTTTVKESKRESGQVYMIELDHSSGAKQYIEETDSDGKIESTSNDIEETPNLPKWKIGSW